MRKQLTLFFLAFGIFGLFVASIQAQPNAAIVTKNGIMICWFAGNEDTGLTSYSCADLDALACGACGECSGDQTDEEIRFHSVETFSSNWNMSVTGPVYTIVLPYGGDPCADTFAIGITDLSWTRKDHGRNDWRLTIGGMLETTSCPSGYLDFNLVVNQSGQKGPRVECVEPD